MLERPRTLQAACAGLVAAILVLFFATTPPILVNDGEGYDGHEYALMTLSFRDGTPVSVAPPWVHRVAIPWVIARSGVETKTAFLVIGVACTFGAAFLVLRLLRRHGAAPAVALLGVTWWLLLAPGPRFSPVFYPVLLDAPGSFLYLALIVCALERRIALFAAALAVASLTRENLLLLAPLPWYSLREVGMARAAGLTALAATPGLLLFGAVQLAPPLAPAAGAGGFLTHATDQLRGVLTNTYFQGVRFTIAPLLSLGVLPVVGLARWRRLRDMLRNEPLWAHVAAAALLFTIGGGLDPERRMHLFAPLLLIVAFGRPITGFWSPIWRAALLTGLHVLAVRAVWPIGRDDAAYAEFALMSMAPRTLAVLAVYELFLGAGAWLTLRRARERPPVAMTA